MLSSQPLRYRIEKTIKKALDKVRKNALLRGVFLMIFFTFFLRKTRGKTLLFPWGFAIMYVKFVLGFPLR